MTIRLIQIITAQTVSEGAGVILKRSIGGPALANLDPFLMLDFFGSDDPDSYIAGFPSHPHRGFNTFTYIIDGRMEHKDSMGNTGTIGAGDAQWMKAGSGVIHSEFPAQQDGLLRGFQLWINLPAENKMDAPEYQEFTAADFPFVETSEAAIKVIIGNHLEHRSPIQDALTQVSYLDVQLQPGAEFALSVESDQQGFIYIFEGEAVLQSEIVAANQLVVLGVESALPAIQAGEQGVRFMIAVGKVLDEPVVKCGPFVMNTQQEIDQAIQDYQTNNFVRERAWIKRERVN